MGPEQVRGGGAREGQLLLLQTDLGLASHLCPHLEGVTYSGAQSPWRKLSLWPEMSRG